MLPLLTMQRPPTLRVSLRGMRTNNIVQRMAAKLSFMGRFGRRRVEAWFRLTCVPLPLLCRSQASRGSHAKKSRLESGINDVLQFDPRE